MKKKLVLDSIEDIESFDLAQDDIAFLTKILVLDTLLPLVEPLESTDFIIIYLQMHLE